jgi:hypothetical protein
MQALGAIALVVAAVGSLTGCCPSEAVGLDVSTESVTCQLDAPANVAIVQVPLRAAETLGFDPRILRVGLDGSEGLVLAGMGVTVGSTPFSESSPPPTALVDEWIAARDEAWLDAPVTSGATSTLVMLLGFDETASAASIESFRIFWGGGEPIYWQRVDVSVALADECVVGVSTT